MTDERREVDAWTPAIASAIATFAVFDPALRFFIGATKRAPEMGARPLLLGLGAALLVSLVVRRAACARSRGRAFAWTLLAGPITLLTIVLSWALTSGQTEAGRGLALTGLFVGALEVIALPLVVIGTNLPVAIASAGDIRSRSVTFFGAAGTLVFAFAADLAICTSQLSVAGRRPAVFALPDVVWLAAMVATSAAIALALAARGGSIGAKLGCFTVALGLLGSAPLLLVSVGRGAWKRIATTTHESLVGATRAPDGSVWILGAGGNIFHLASGATDLTVVDASHTIDKSPYGICAAKNGLWIVGYGGMIVRGEDEGRRWVVERPSSREPTLRAVWCDADAASLAVGDAGTILRRTPKGEWETRPSPAAATLTAVTGKGRDRFVVPFEGALLRSHDAGETFRAYGRTTYGTKAISLGDDGALWTAGATVQRSSDLGATFAIGQTTFHWLTLFSLSNGDLDDFQALAQVGAVTFVAGNRVGRTEDAGSTYFEEKVYVTTAVHALAVDGAGRVIGVGDDGLVIVRTLP